MKFDKAVKMASCLALALALILPASLLRAQRVVGRSAENKWSDYPSPADSKPGVQVTNDSGAAVRGVKTTGTSGPGPSPSAGASNINDYRFQDEQINLDANAGNVRVLRTNEKVLMNDFVTVTIPIKNANEREMRNVLRSIVSLEGGRVEMINDKLTGNSWVEIICPSFMVPYFETAIPMLDVPWLREYDTGSADVYYKAKNRSAANIDVIASQWASDNGFSVIDETANAVSRIDEPYRIAQYLRGAATVDIAANEVLLEVTIYEVASINDSKIGLDYISWKNGPGRNLFSFVYSGLDAQSRNKVVTSVFDPFTFVGGGVGSAPKLLTDLDQKFRSVNYLLPSNYIDFLQNTGRARVLNRQEIMVKSSRPAFIAADQELVAIVAENPGGPGNTGIASNIASRRIIGFDPNQSVSSPGVAGAGGGQNVRQVNSDVRDVSRRLNNINAGQTGVSLCVTPFVGLESMELVIKASVSDLNGVTPTGQPIINQRTITTTVRLLDGEPYVIAGLYRSRDIEETAKAPGLGDLPVVGYLFGGETHVQRKTDVVIVVTPHFYVSAQSNTTIGHTNTREIVEGNATTQLPQNHLGFDMWLLDPDKTL